MKISVQFLLDNRACEGSVKTFVDLFDYDDVEVNLDNLMIAADAGLDVSWLIRKLKVDVDPEFRRVETIANHSFFLKIKPFHDKYHKELAPLINEYDKNASVGSEAEALGTVLKETKIDLCCLQKRNKTHY